MFNNLFNPMYPVIFNPPFMQNRTGYGFRKVVVMSDKQIRKQNLRKLRLEYGESFRRALEERHLTPEEFSTESKIPLKFIEEHLSGEIRFFGHLNYISFLLNKRIKIKLID
mgnify:FL=1